MKGYETLKWPLPSEPLNSRPMCSIPDDHIDPGRSAFFMARSVFGDISECAKC